MNLFMPDRVYFEPSSLRYRMGQDLYKYFTDKNIEIIETGLSNRVTGIPGKTERENYFHSKKTLVVSTKKTMRLDVCKPSADFEFSLATNCPGLCEYCYLQTTQGKKPYIRIYVNIEEIFDNIKKYITNNLPHTTTFEAASASDPLALEHLTGSLKKTIEFFSNLEKGRLRVVTKYDNVDSLISVQHNDHTRFRFSINANYVIDSFEHGTPRLGKRIVAASKMSKAFYPLGFIIAPIIAFDGWEEEYRELIEQLYINLEPSVHNSVTFELIQHRYTENAKNLIYQRFPRTKLEMSNDTRKKKWGKYGRIKYVYPTEKAKDIQSHITSLIEDKFPNAIIEYFT